MKTEFKSGNLVFVPAGVFNQEIAGERGQLKYRKRRKWSVYEIRNDSLRKYIGSILTANCVTKAQILEAWDAKN